MEIDVGAVAVLKVSILYSNNTWEVHDLPFHADKLQIATKVPGVQP